MGRSRSSWLPHDESEKRESDKHTFHLQTRVTVLFLVRYDDTTYVRARPGMICDSEKENNPVLSMKSNDEIPSRRNFKPV